MTCRSIHIPRYELWYLFRLKKINYLEYNITHARTQKILLMDVQWISMFAGGGGQMLPLDPTMLYNYCFNEYRTFRIDWFKLPVTSSLIMQCNLNVKGFKTDFL